MVLSAQALYIGSCTTTMLLVLLLKHMAAMLAVTTNYKSSSLDTEAVSTFAVLRERKFTVCPFCYSMSAHLHGPGTIYSPNSDIGFRFSDGVIFKSHSPKAMKRHSTGSRDIFRGAGMSPAARSSDIADVRQSTSVVELLLQYISREPPPDLTKVDFEPFMELAEGAEKYDVGLPVARQLCRSHMKYASWLD